MPAEDKNMEERIMLKAEALFLRKGFAGTSTVEIAREAGCNQALVHYYFRTKEKLFNAVYEKKFKVFFINLRPLVEELELPIRERIVNMATLHFQMLSREPEMPRFVINELVMNEERQHLILDRFNDFSKLWYVALQAELDAEHQAGRMAKLQLIDLLLDIVMLNVSSFVTMPVSRKIFESFYPDRDYLQARLEENIQLINLKMKYQDA